MSSVVPPPQKALSRFHRIRSMVDLVLAGLVLVLVGMGVVAVAMLSQGRRGGAEVRGGGVVMVGPIPIVFGSDARWASVAIVLAILLIVLTFVLNLV